MKYEMTIINYPEKRQLTMECIRALDLEEIDELLDEVIWDDYILSENTRKKFIIDIEMVKYEKLGWVKGAKFEKDGKTHTVKGLRYISSSNKCGSLACRAYYEDHGTHMAVEHGELSMSPIDKCKLIGGE